MIDRFPRLVALAAALALPFVLLALVLHLAVDVPYWDEWEWADLMFRSHAGTLTFGDLWKQHAEHRIFLDQLAAIALDRLGGWSVVREQCVSILLLILTQLVIWRIVRRSVAASIAPFAFLAASLVLYDMTQYENFRWGFQMAWFMCNLGVVTVAWVLTDPPDEPRPLMFAVIPAACASLASSQGLIAWVVGFVALVLMRRGVAATAAWTLWGVAISIVVRIGLEPVDVGHVSLLHNLRHEALFALTYLGAPLAREGGILWSAVAGAVTLTGLLVALALDVRSDDRRQRLAHRAPWYAIASYAVAAALLTAPARLGLGMQEALASRYSSIALMLDVALVAIAATYLHGLQERRRPLVWVSTVAVAGVIALASVPDYVHWRIFAADRRADFAALRTGDAAAAHDLYPDAGRLAAYEIELRTIGDGLFHR